jgi:hypothetical protein
MVKNVFEDLGFAPDEAAALKLKADLHSKTRKARSRGAAAGHALTL